LIDLNKLDTNKFLKAFTTKMQLRPSTFTIITNQLTFFPAPLLFHGPCQSSIQLA